MYLPVYLILPAELRCSSERLVVVVFCIVRKTQEKIISI